VFQQFPTANRILPSFVLYLTQEALVFLQPLWALTAFFSSLIYTQSVGLVGREDQPVARPLPTHKINAHNADIHASSVIRTHDPSVRASKDSSAFYRAATVISTLVLRTKKTVSINLINRVIFVMEIWCVFY
jgi:hypothetical protein